MNLQELADQPGHGNARKALIKAGKWDEAAGNEYAEFQVKLTAEVTYDDKYIVKERSLDEAVNLAIKKMVYDYDIDEDDITEVDAEEV